MPNPIAIVDYGMGNLRSVQNAVKHLALPGSLAGDKKPQGQTGQGFERMAVTKK